jgi:hypothetical protein
MCWLDHFVNNDPTMVFPILHCSQNDVYTYRRQVGRNRYNCLENSAYLKWPAATLKLDRRWMTVRFSANKTVRRWSPRPFLQAAPMLRLHGLQRYLKDTKAASQILWYLLISYDTLHHQYTKSPALRCTTVNQTHTQRQAQGWKQWMQHS